MRFARLFPLITVTGLLASCGGDGGSIGNGPPGTGPSNVAPTAAFTAQCGAAAALECDFVNTSTDTDGTIDLYAWDFGDLSARATTEHTTHAYAAPGGRFTVTLRVTDDDGEMATASRQVEVYANVPPTAHLAVSCTALTCAFTGWSSDANVGDSVASHTWDFGDGRTSTDANPHHKYAAAGSYTVTLTVTDNLAEAGSASQQVTLPFQLDAFPVLYVRVAPHSIPSGARSRYLLYEDGTFALQIFGGPTAFASLGGRTRGGTGPSISISMRTGQAGGQRAPSMAIIP